jgi:hypothetical protein
MKSLIFNHITSPVGRAGGANLMLSVSAIFPVLLVKAISLPVTESFLVGGFLVCCWIVGVRSTLPLPQ